MNKVEIMGRLTKDVEMLKAKSGTEVAKITLAVPRKLSKENEVDFIDAVAFGKMAENLSKYVAKGNRLIITGQLNLNNYQDKDGNKRTSTVIVIEDFYFVDFKTKKDESEQTTLEY